MTNGGTANLANINVGGNTSVIGGVGFISGQVNASSVYSSGAVQGSSFIGNATSATYATSAGTAITNANDGNLIPTLGQVSGALPGTNVLISREEELSLLSFSFGNGINMFGAGAYASGPYYSQPVIGAGGANMDYRHQVPQWVTNAVFRLQIQWAAPFPLTWTNVFTSDCQIPPTGRNLGGGAVTRVFTLPTNNITYLYVTNTWADTRGTNLVKSLEISGTAVPTNTSYVVGITGVHVWWKGVFDGTNW